MDRRIGFYSTYKELKHFLLYSIFPSMSIVFIVPIRNWNMFHGLMVNMHLYRFYSTYKELKPFSQRKDGEKIYSFL